MRTTLALAATVAVGLAGMGRLLAAEEGRPPALRPCVVLTGTDSQVKERSCLRIESQEEWTKVWRRHRGDDAAAPYDEYFNPLGLPGIDFDKYMVVAVFQGEGWNSAGVKAVSIVEEKDRILFRFEGKWYQTAGPDGGGKKVSVYGFFVLPRTAKTVVVEENAQGLIGHPPLWKERAILVPGGLPLPKH